MRKFNSLVSTMATLILCSPVAFAGARLTKATTSISFPWGKLFGVFVVCGILMFFAFMLRNYGKND